MKQRSRFFARLAAALLILSMMLSSSGCSGLFSGSVKAGNLTEKIDRMTVSGKAADKTFTASQYDFAAKLTSCAAPMRRTAATAWSRRCPSCSPSR